MSKEYKKIEYRGYTFPCEITKSGKPGKLEKDLEKVMRILDKESLTSADRMQLLSVYNVAYHESGKIEGIFSLDSTATNCSFCVKMRKFAADHPELRIICSECYDYKQEQFKINSLARHTLNLMIMESVDFSIEELAILESGLFVRVNSSGDSSNDTYARNMIRYAYAHKESHIAIWTKNTITYIRACDLLGKPENVVLIQSSMRIDAAAIPAKYFDYAFTVYFDESKVQAAIANGAAECNGKKCKACGYKCYCKAWNGSNIAELLRK